MNKNHQPNKNKNKTTVTTKKDATPKYVKGKGYVNTYIKKEEPEDYETEAKLNIALFDHDTIQALVDECKPFANASEFQIHYHSLQVHITKDYYEVVITVPLAFYNFDQEVSSGSVSMEMKDVNKISDEAKKLVEKQTKELFEELPILNQLEALGFDVKFTTSDNGSIHRHPGDFSFSSVDYDKDPDEPGVIYRQAKAENLYQTDSVIYLPYTDTPKFVCTETRIVNVEPIANDGGIKGRYTEFPTYSFITKPKKKPNLLFDLLGSEDPDASDSIFEQFKTTTSMGFKLHEYPLVVEVLKAFSDSSYLPDISNVIGKRIEQETRVVTYNHHNVNRAKDNTFNTKEPKESHTKHSTGEQNDFYGAYYENWDEEWGYDYAYGSSATTEDIDVDDISEPTYYEPLDENVEASDEDSFDKEQFKEEGLTAIIDGKETVYNEDYQMWLPIKTIDMTDNELIQYVSEHG